MLEEVGIDHWYRVVSFVSPVTDLVRVEDGG
jgi:hypothetical protein